MTTERCEGCGQVLQWGDHSTCLPVRQPEAETEPEVGPILPREANLERVRALKDQYRKVKT